jgi:hypothetical protein
VDVTQSHMLNGTKGWREGGDTVAFGFAVLLLVLELMAVLVSVSAPSLCVTLFSPCFGQMQVERLFAPS